MPHQRPRWLRCDDIFETLNSMSKLGFAPLELPRNYYDDLAARFGFDHAQIERLQSQAILYDEDETGAFYQAYSQPMAGGFFFEIVQRLDGYTGYGAPNAPFRTAAMKRQMRRGTK